LDCLLSKLCQAALLSIKDGRYYLYINNKNDITNHGIGNPDPGLMKAQNVAGLTQWMGIKPSPSCYWDLKRQYRMSDINKQ
jgi:hypothetical protein